MASAMLGVAETDPRAEARFDRACLEAEAFPCRDVSLPSLREIVQGSVVPRLCRAFEKRSLTTDQVVVLRPDLLTSRHAPALHTQVDARFGVSAQDPVGTLIEDLFANDVDAACVRLEAIRAQGQMLERIYLELLMPAAVRLNQLLADDLYDCAAVTLAYLNLHSVLRRFAIDFRDEGGSADNGSRALLASPYASSGTAGLQMFGLLFMAEFFRRDGWDALTERSLSSVSFRDTVESQWFDIVEVLASCDEDLDEVASGIRLIRRGARNRDVGIIACGRVFSERPEIIRLVGADRSASDLPAGLALAKAFVSRPPVRQRLS